jgi:thymidylate kinase
VVGDKANIQGVLFYDTTEETVKNRILARGKTSGRADDNIESLVKRLRTYHTETYPIIEEFKADGVKVFRIDSSPPIEEVWATTQAVIAEVKGEGTKWLYGIGATAAVGAVIAGYHYLGPKGSGDEKK